VRRLEVRDLSCALSPSNALQLPSRLAQVLELCPHLDEVDIAFSSGIGMELGGVVALLNASRRKLKTLVVGKVEKAETVRGEKGSRRALATFFDTQTDVEVLTMSGADGHLAISTDPPAWQLQKLTTDASSFAHLAHHSKATLKSLVLSYSRCPTPSQRLNLTPFTALQSLTLTDRHFGQRSQVDQHFHHILPLFPPTLTTLRIRFIAPLADTTFDLLSALLPPTLVHLDLRFTGINHSGITNLFFKGLFPQLKTLEYSRPSPSAVKLAPAGLPGMEAEEKQLCELSCRQGVRIIPTGHFWVSPSFESAVI
jgi:hypothetical protein